MRSSLREACEHFNETLAKRLLDEEAMRRKLPGQAQTETSSTPNQATDHLRTASEGGAQFCLLWGLNACQRTEQACKKVHLRPYCGSRDKGCLLNKHGGALKRHVGSSVAGYPSKSKGSGMKRGRSRTRSRSRRPNDSKYQRRTDGHGKGSKRSPS